jgi:hypothetical protein
MPFMGLRLAMLQNCARKNFLSRKIQIPIAPTKLRQFVSNCAIASRMAQFFIRLIWLE